MTHKPIIYFLCTGNSCRSQMAEGFGKKYLGEEWDVRSAGIEAHGLNPKAVKVMAEKDVDISRQASSVIHPDILQQVELVVTLCGDAKDNCPMTPPHVNKAHWGFPDPAKATGTEAEKWCAFQDVRDQIEARIKAFAMS
ncbi:Arsenate reductase (glutaredoxin) [Lentibacillus sp. JNUCC-1]|uniref:arsenate reductase (thioredoxin) n=1 Tax=Lentibacillus sp. JNUCC-1 TaxID=2654513 RepID=UPI0012E78E28|nr:arsenate reductase (thioredoxin) [Lentibacillus sp. JNUCC-1]MUV38471.1 Arsenate reductase (glutaredoxin) [Lentibacillus sp. JNUCC-1]